MKHIFHLLALAGILALAILIVGFFLLAMYGLSEYRHPSPGLILNLIKENFLLLVISATIGLISLTKKEVRAWVRIWMRTQQRKFDRWAERMEVRLERLNDYLESGR